jgi:Flp pilus assembly protein TadB
LYQWTIQRNLQHWEHNTHDEDKQNTKIQWTIQRNLQHWEHNTQDEDKQNTKIQWTFSGLSIVFLCFVCRHPVYFVPNVVSFSGLSIVFLCFVCLHPVYCVPNVNKTKNTMDNPEKLTTLGTQYTG